MTAPGIVSLIKKGVITSERKNVNTGIAVFTALAGCTAEEVPFAHNNPLIELRDAEYVVSINTVSSHDNYIAINNAISIDFSGQINSESIGSRQWTGTGGQPELHMGAVISKGGRAITLLRSTAARRSRVPHRASASGGGGGNRSPHLCRYHSNRVRRSSAPW